MRPGGVPERSKGTRCKRVGSAFAGSNPAPATCSVTLAPCADRPERIVGAGVAKRHTNHPSVAQLEDIGLANVDRNAALVSPPYVTRSGRK